MEIQELSEYVRLSRGALGLLKDALGLLPAGDKKQEAEQQIAAAEEAMRRSDAELAMALGYNLCQCTFPPTPMLSKGRHPVHGKEIFKCDNCGKQEPSEHMFEQMDRVKAHNEGRRGSSWVNARRGR